MILSQWELEDELYLAVEQVLLLVIIVIVLSHEVLQLRVNILCQTYLSTN